VPEPLTYLDTANRQFEMAYWNDIKTLAEGNIATRTTLIAPRILSF